MTRPDGVTWNHSLLTDDFSGYPEGVAAIPYSYVRRIGPWETRNIDYAWRLGPGGHNKQSQTWGVKRQQGRSFLVQPDPNYQSYICAGRDEWQTYRFEASFIYQPVAETLGSSFGCDHDNERLLTGLLARYQTQRHHYFWGMDANSRPLLAKRVEERLIELFRGATPLPVNVLRVWAIELEGENIRGYIDNELVATVHDGEYAWGRVGFRTDRPAEFTGMRVLTKADEAAHIRRRVAEADSRRRHAAERFTPPRVWRTLVRDDGWHYRFFLDIDLGGAMRIVHVNVFTETENDPPAIEALGLDDEPLWRRGTWVPSGGGVKRHVAACVADLAGNGTRQIILGYGQTVEVLDAATGRTLRWTTLAMDQYRCSPVAQPVIGYVFPVRFLTGAGRQLVVMSDSYAAALDGDLNLLWEHTGNLGHGPAAGDLDGDGFDEVMLGYSLLDRQGRLRWSVPGLNTKVNSDMIDAHADWTEFVRLRPDGPLRVLLAASQKGLYFLDAGGRVLWRRIVGHVQYFMTGNFDHQQDAQWVVASTLWESAGICRVFDADGAPRQRWELPMFSPLCRLPWPGYPADLILIPEYNRAPAIMDVNGQILWQAEPEWNRMRLPLNKNNEPPFRTREFAGNIFSADYGTRLVLYAPGT